MSNEEALQLHVHAIPLNLEVDSERYSEEEDEITELKNVSDPQTTDLLLQVDEPSTSYQTHTRQKIPVEKNADDEIETISNEAEDENELIDLSVDLPPTTLNLLKLNLAHQEVLEQQLALVEKFLNENNFKKRIINEEYLRNLSNKKTPRVEISIFNKKLLIDESGSTPPVNIETLNRKSEVGEFFIPNAFGAPKWTKSMDTALLDGVKKCALRRETEPLLSKLSYLKEKFKKSADPELERKMKEVKKQIATKSNPSQLIGGRNRDWDWAAISNVDLDNCTTAINCELRWRNRARPGIKRTAWSGKEDEILKKFLEQNKTRDWNEVSLQLEGRTPADCCKRFQLKFNPNFKRSYWTPEEDEKFKKLVERFRVGEVIPYTKVALHMESRVGEQLIHRWTKTLNPKIKRSRWSPEEDAALIRAVVQYGEKWSLIRDLGLIKGRNDSQIRERYTKCLAGLTRKPWTKQEDDLLGRLVKHFDRKWSIIAGHLKPRTDRQCLKRWAILKGIRKKGNPVLYRKKPGGPINGLQSIRDKLTDSISEEQNNKENGEFSTSHTPVDTQRVKNLIRITPSMSTFSSMAFSKELTETLSKKMSSAEVLNLYNDVLKMREDLTKQNSKAPKMGYEMEVDKDIRALIRQHFRPLKVKAHLPGTPLSKVYKNIESTASNLTPKQIFVHYVQALNIDAERALEAIRRRKNQTGAAPTSSAAMATSEFVRNLYLPLCSPNTATVGAFHVLMKDTSNRVKSAKQIIVHGSESVTSQVEGIPRKHRIENLLDDMRSSYEYKVFRSRFNALMTWPTLLGSLAPYQRTPSGNFHVPQHVGAGKRKIEDKRNGKEKRVKK